MHRVRRPERQPLLMVRARQVVAVLIVAALACGPATTSSCAIWPETRCGRCDGSGRNAGWTSKRFGKCKRCAGTGRKPRLGNRIRDRRG